MSLKQNTVQSTSPQSIPVNILRPADIIVSTTAASVSGTIRTTTGSSVSHASLYIGNKTVIEAIGKDGVVKRTLSSSLQDATLAIALRRRNLTKQQATEVVKHAQAFFAKKIPYDEVGAIGAGVSSKRGGTLASASCIVNPIILAGCAVGAGAVANNASKKNADKAFFCSELVARVFELAGVPISDSSPSYTTPRQIRTASKLLYVAHIVDK
jgi:uncharacterized protein YycO